MRLLNITLISALLLFNTSCVFFRNPDKAWNKAVDKTELVQDKIQKNEDSQLQQGRNYVYATKVALELDPSTNQFNNVETTLNDRAGIVLGQPSVEDAVTLRTMVENLLSTNQTLVAKGEKQLATQDKKIIALQEANVSLQTQLDKANAKVIEVGDTNAVYASHWTSLTKIFWGIIYLVIGVFIIKLLAVVLPPPYNSIVGLIAVPIGLVTKALHAFVPEAKKTAGVIATGVYDNTKSTLKQIIAAIEEAKNRKPEVGEELKPFLKDETNREVSRPIIEQIKQELGY